MYQTCPICKGKGYTSEPFGIGTSITCPTCKGRRIISELSGEPPVDNSVHKKHPITDIHKRNNVSDFTIDNKIAEEVYNQFNNKVKDITKPIIMLDGSDIIYSPLFHKAVKDNPVFIERKPSSYKDIDNRQVLPKESCINPKNTFFYQMLTIPDINNITEENILNTIEEIKSNTEPENKHVKEEYLIKSKAGVEITPPTYNIGVHIKYKYNPNL